MEDIAPPLKLTLHLIEDLKNGNSLRGSLKEYVDFSSLQFSKNLQDVLFRTDQGLGIEKVMDTEPSSHRAALYELIELGLNGQPVLQRLVDLQVDIEEACKAEIEKTLQTMPYKMLIPMMVFLLPAYLLVLFGPLVSTLIRGVQF